MSSINNNKTSNKIKRISIDIDEKALEMVDIASQKEFRSRTSFLVSSAVEKAKQVLEQN